MLDELQELANSGADFNECDNNGENYLIRASKKKNLSLVKFLIQNTDQINKENTKGLTALYYATKFESLDLIKILVQSGAIISDEIYMLSIHNNMKKVTLFFDSFDTNKKIFKR